MTNNGNEHMNIYIYMYLKIYMYIYIWFLRWENLENSQRMQPAWHSSLTWHVLLWVQCYPNPPRHMPDRTTSMQSDEFSIILPFLYHFHTISIFHAMIGYRSTTCRRRTSALPLRLGPAHFGPWFALSALQRECTSCHRVLSCSWPGWHKLHKDKKMKLGTRNQHKPT